MAIVNTRVIYNFNETDTSLDTRLATVEETLGTVDVEKLKADTDKEAEDRAAADTALEEKIGEVEEAYKAADTAIQTKLIELEAAITDAGSDLEEGYKAADAALKTEIEGDYKAADTALKTEVEEGYTAADAALKTEIETAYKAADEDIQEALDQEIEDRKAAITVEETKRDEAIEEAIKAYDETVAAKLETMQTEIDGAITTWFGSGVPTADNSPASEWTDAKDKNVHLGDIYYDNDTGYAYRYKLADGTYSWDLIKDSDITKAIADAAAAQATADEKLDKNLGVAEAGHLLAVDDDGNVTAEPPKGLLIHSETGNKTFYLSLTDAGQLQLSEVI